MEYKFDKEKFKESFNAKDNETKSADSFRLTHKPDIQFKLYPYKASGKTQAPIVYNLEDVVTGFFREASNKVTEPILFEELCKNLMDDVDVADEDMDYFKDMIQSLFFRGSDFIADNLGLYPYQTTTNNKSADNLAHFLYSVMGISEEDCKKIEVAKSQYQFNVLEDMVIKNIESRNVCDYDEINGNQDYCMPNTINLSITGVESEALMLSSKQFCGISNGSACTSHEYSPSYVLTAMGLDADRISSAIRISWGAHTDKDELINELSELIAVAKSLVF